MNATDTVMVDPARGAESAFKASEVGKHNDELVLAWYEAEKQYRVDKCLEMSEQSTPYATAFRWRNMRWCVGAEGKRPGDF